MVRLTREPLAVDPIVAEVSRRTSGAVATFVGIAREFTDGHRVVRLEYEAYEEMALKTMAQIEEEVRATWAVDDVAILHRLGLLEIGEASVLIAVASPHRPEAFAACRYAIDRLKEIVPIWKREVFDTGPRWVGSEPVPA